MWLNRLHLSSQRQAIIDSSLIWAILDSFHPSYTPPSATTCMTEGGWWWWFEHQLNRHSEIQANNSAASKNRGFGVNFGRFRILFVTPFHSNPRVTPTFAVRGGNDTLTTSKATYNPADPGNYLYRAKFGWISSMCFFLLSLLGPLQHPQCV